MGEARLLVLGTHNRKKGEELRELLEPQGFRIATLADFPHAIEVDEVGDSFQENAAQKASVQARHLGQWVLGEDSGLVVDALGGAPGIYSARFAGPRATDEQNNQLLLEKLEGVPPAERTAHYTCCLALADPAGTIVLASEGECHGRIASAPAGSHGFGYDPVFEVIEYHRTFGQLGPEVKRALSHRARAIRRFIPPLLELVRTGRWE